MKRSDFSSRIRINKLPVILIILISFAWGCVQEKVSNIDPVKVSPGKFTILLENEFVRVVEYKLNPGEKDNWHTHPPKTSYILSGGTLKIVPENGAEFTVNEQKGNVSWMNYIGKHYAENIGNTTVVVLLTEIKSLE